MGLLDSLKKAFAGNPRVDLSTRFERLKEAVAGTMSKFYKARDLKSGEVVGLKLLDSKKLDPIEARYRGLGKPSEGEIGSQISGENIVKTLEWGVARDGTRFVVQEYIEGPGLHTLLGRRTEMDAAARIDLVRQAAKAVAAVHAAGFVHRDVCPRNFLLEPGGRLVLIDFGLTVPDKPAFMQPGNRVGTPSYMAPEVVRRRQADHRLDIFSFGVSAYEILTNEPPWPRGGSGHAAMRSTEPNDIREYWQEIPEALARLVMSCLSADPEGRPASMENIVTALDGVQVPVVSEPSA
jgi:serine/threonine protein kinase